MQAGYRRSNTMCCVVGCNSSYNNTDRNIKFYSFPGKWYEKDRRQIWIDSVRRHSGSKEPWEPKAHHKICSKHFVNGEKSNKSLSPSYNPTIFPSICSSVYQNVDVETKRLLKKDQSRSVKTVATITSDPSQQDQEVLIEDTKDFSCQVDMHNDGCDVNFVFECTFSSNFQDISTQANISKANIPIILTSDKCVGNNDSIDRDRFYDHQFLKNDHLFNCQLNDLETYKCKRCCFEVDMKIILHQHIKEAHGPIKQQFINSDYTLKTFTCNTCSFETYCILVFAGHDCKPNSNDLNWFECEHCDYKVKAKWRLDGHMKEKHVTVAVDSSNSGPKHDQWFECEQCSYQVMEKWRLEGHIREKHASSECEHCPYKAKTRRRLEEHVKQKHISSNDLKWFKCDHCTYKTKQERCLEWHEVRKHLNPKKIDKRFKCDQCAYQCDRKFGLNRHAMFKHGNPEDFKWFTCGLCPRKYAAKSSLIRHLETKHYPTESV